MRRTPAKLRRLLLGLSVDETTGQFESPEARRKLRVLHERHNRGVFHELRIAQRKRERLSPDRRCHITRFAKPGVKGFQCYVKEDPGDYIVTELWPAEASQAGGVNPEEGKDAHRDTDSGCPAASSIAADDDLHVPDVEDGICSRGQEALRTEEGATVEDAILLQPTKLAVACRDNVVSRERELCREQRAIIVEHLNRAAARMRDLIHNALQESRDSRALLEQRKSVVDRLVEDVQEATQKGFRTLSSSTHFLEPQQLATIIAQRKDKVVLAAFRSRLLAFPAPDVSVSLSLWVAGASLLDETLAAEFPFHLVKHASSVVPGSATSSPGDGLADAAGRGVAAGTAPPGHTHRLPRAHVEVYFSPEMYQLVQMIGKEGVVNLRRFIGRAMKQQHSPRAISPSIVMNSSYRAASKKAQREAHAEAAVERASALRSAVYLSAQIPWSNEWSARVSRSTDAAFHSTIKQDVSVSMQRMQEAIHLVWRVWGTLVKDLKVWGDLDFMYLKVDEAAHLLKEGRRRELLHLTATSKSPAPLPLGMDVSPTAPHRGSLPTGGSAVPGQIQRLQKAAKQQSGGPAAVLRQSVLIPADFVVIECVLEKRGLSHRFVVEDLIEVLTEIQRDAIDTARLSAIDAAHAQFAHENLVRGQQERAAAENGDEGGAEEGIGKLYDDDDVDSLRTSPRGKGRMKGKALRGKSHAMQPSPQHPPKSVRPPPATLEPVPVIYAPRVVISHAGVIESRSHSYQRIRIRGSCLAHVEAVMEALESGEHFTERGIAGSATAAADQTENLSFKAVSACGSDRTGAITTTSRAGRHAILAALASNRQRPFSSMRRFRPNHQPAVDQKEREFWAEHYYRIHNPEVVFHDRVDVDAAVTKEGLQLDMLSPRMRSLLWQRFGGGRSGVRGPVERDPEDGVEVASRRQKGGTSSYNHNYDDDDEGDLAAVDDVYDSIDDWFGSGLRSGERQRNKQPEKKGASSSFQGRSGREEARSPSDHAVALEDIATMLTPEKTFECLCVDMELESAEYDLRIGENAGYRYNVKLKHIPVDDLELVKPAMTTVTEKGFINYYASQRFGTYTMHNMHPGMHLLKGEFRAAASVIVQQFYIDAAAAAQRKFGHASAGDYGSGMASGGGGGGRMAGYIDRGMYNFPDFSWRLGGQGGRSVDEHGSALQVVLHNALRAAELAAEDEVEESGSVRRAPSRVGAGPSISVADEMCRDAFLNVVGLPVCRMLVGEFLSFVWNDILNQRLQRYGTYAILPGDLVLPRTPPSLATMVYMSGASSVGMGARAAVELECGPSINARTANLARASRRDIDTGKYTYFDVVLPVPGFGVSLPDNHTSDLYVVTLKRWGFPFNPETRQWDVFCGTMPQQESRRGPGELSGSGSRPARRSSEEAPDDVGMRGRSGPASSPGRTGSFSTLSLLLQEEQAIEAPFADPECFFDGDDDEGRETGGVGSAGRLLRPDLSTPGRGGYGYGWVAADADGGLPSHAPGNPLRIAFYGGYRHTLVSVERSLDWRMNITENADPYHRWFSSLHTACRVSSSRKVEPPVQRAVARRSSATAPYSLGGLDIWSGVTTESEGKPVTGIVAADAAGVPVERPIAAKTNEVVKMGPAAVGRTSTRYTPYWLPKVSDGVLELCFALPSSVYPSMLLREVSKSDVNAADIVDIHGAVTDRRALQDSQGGSGYVGTQRALRRKEFTQRPRALSVALLHQNIFRSGGMRYSLLPSTRGFDDVVK